MTEEGGEEPLGNATPLIRAKNVETVLGFSEIYLKYEGNNETGTHKDRIARIHAKRAAGLGHDTLTAGTCGNFGVALAHYSRFYGISPMIFAPKSYSLKRLEEMRRLGAKVIAVSRKYEGATEISRQKASENGWYDANPGPRNREINYAAYGQIAEEICDELHESPTAVAVPVGNGTTLAGIYYGFTKRDRGGESNGIPAMVGASTVLGNPIVTSFLGGQRKVTKLHPSEIRETRTNEPLVNYESYDGDDALAAISRTNGCALPVTDMRMEALSWLVKAKEGLEALPASASALEALRVFVRMGEHHSKYVVVLTGGKPYWRKP